LVRNLLRLLALLTLVAVFAACDPPHGIVLWHAYQGEEREALAAAAARWNDVHPDTPIQLVGVPYSAFGDKLTSAIPGGNGPDLFIYPQDRIGDWADANIIEPIEFWVDDAHAARFSDASLAALAYHGSLWGLPLAVKSLVMFYRTDIISTPPRTTDELLALAPMMRAKGGYAVAYANSDLYGHAPWLFGFGGSVFDGDHLAIATPEAANAMKFAQDLVTTKAAPQGAEGPLVATLFNEGRAATVISGPWFTGDIATNLAGKWKVAELPIVSPTGLPATPFLGAEAILMSARAHDKELAFAAMDALTSDINAIDRAKRTHQTVPNVAAYNDPAIQSDELLQAFGKQLAHTVPMSVSPAMRLVWTPYKTALSTVLNGAEPGPTLRNVEKEINGYLIGSHVIVADEPALRRVVPEPAPTPPQKAPNTIAPAEKPE
jgi:maltose-binding protein MalE